MIPFADYCRQRGFSRQRGSQLRKAGRFGDALISQPHGRTSRYFVTSIEAADQAMAATSRSEPRLTTATATPPTQPTNGKAMTRAEAIRLKAEHDAHSAGLKREALALENQVERGKFILVADSERQVDTWTARVVSMLSSIPSRVAQAGVNAAVVDVVRREINRIREEIARDES